MPQRTRSQRLNGLFPLSYLGVVPVSPINFVIDDRPPTVNDYKNFYVGDIWLDMDTNTPPTAENIYMLVSVANNVATWVNFAGTSALESLTGNVGGAVFGDAADNINVLGDIAVGVTVSGNPGTNTLTITSTSGNPFAQSLTGNVGGPVPFDVNGNINVVGDGTTITITGNPGTNTLTASLVGGGIAADSFPTDSGTATPDGTGALNILAQNATLGAGSSVLFSAPGPSNTVQLNVTDAGGNTILGASSGNLTLTGTNNNGFGTLNLQDLTTGSANCAFGRGVLANITTGSTNVAIGNGTGNNYVSSESRNIIIGNSPGLATETGTIRVTTSGGSNTSNIFIGHGAGNETYTIGSAVLNIGIGDGSLAALTTSNTNTCVGYRSGNAITTGISNTSLGSSSLRNATTQEASVAIGQGALNVHNAGTGQNTAVGYASLFAVTSGSFNTAIGYATGIGGGGATGITTGEYNVLAGHGAGSLYTGAESHNVIINSFGVVADSNTLRIGTATGAGQQQLNRAFISGIRGITTGVNDAIAVLIDSADQLGTVSSSIRYKENIKDLGHDSEIIYDLRPVKFNYKQHPEIPAWGLIAEEVAEVFPQLAVYDKEGNPETVKYHDLSVLLLNELQKMAKRIDHLEFHQTSCDCNKQSS